MKDAKHFPLPTSTDGSGLPPDDRITCKDCRNRKGIFCNGIAPGRRVLAHIPTLKHRCEDYRR